MCALSAACFVPVVTWKWLLFRGCGSVLPAIAQKRGFNGGDADSVENAHERVEAFGTKVGVSDLRLHAMADTLDII